MFRIISIVALLICVVSLIICRMVCQKPSPCAAPTSQGSRLYSLFRWLIGAVTVLSVLILAITGFYPSLVVDEFLTGYLLMLHCTAAPVFIACLAIFILLNAHHNRFTRPDGSDPGCPKPCHALAPKICFWLMAVLALPVALSAVLEMFPLFGTESLDLLFQVHKYSALLLLLATISYFTLRPRYL